MKITYSEPLQEEVTPSGEGTKTVSMSKKVKIEDASVERLVEEIEELQALGFDTDITIRLTKPKE